MTSASNPKSILEEIQEKIVDEASATAPLTSGALRVLDVFVPTTNELDVEIELERSEQVAAEREILELEEAARSSWLMWTWLQIRRAALLVLSAPRSFLFLVTLGVLTAVGGFLIDLATFWLQGTRHSISEGWGAQAYFGWTLWCVIFSLLATAATDFLDPRAEGSGIPQLKSILAGTDLSGHLSIRAAAVKAVGLVLAMGGGLAVGKEGPFSALAAAAAHALAQVPFCGEGRGNEAGMRQMLAAAVAAGVTAVLGAPVGGVLFSIEVTSTYYQVSSLWRGFLCALACVFTFEVLNALRRDELFYATEFLAADVGWDIVAFAGLAIVCGVLASLLVLLTARLQVARRVLLQRFGRAGRYSLVGFASFVVATALFLTPSLRKSDQQAINDLFQENQVGADAGGGQSGGGSGSGGQSWESLQDLGWNTGGSAILSLALYLTVRLVVVPISISLPLPCGLFTPMFALGAGLGRFFGELLAVALPGAGVVPGAYAVVGAASLSAGVTHTLSTAVIIFELTGQIRHLVPVLLGVVLAYTISASLQPSVYDVLLAVNGLPHIGRAHRLQLYSLVARDILHHRVPYLTPESSFVEALACLRAMPPRGKDTQPIFEFPVLDSAGSARLLGTVTRSSLQAVFDRRAVPDALLKKVDDWLQLSDGGGVQGEGQGARGVLGTGVQGTAAVELSSMDSTVHRGEDGPTPTEGQESSSRGRSRSGSGQGQGDAAGSGTAGSPVGPMSVDPVDDGRIHTGLFPVWMLQRIRFTGGVQPVLLGDASTAGMRRRRGSGADAGTGLSVQSGLPLARGSSPAAGGSLGSPLGSGRGAFSRGGQGGGADSLDEAEEGLLGDGSEARAGSPLPMGDLLRSPARIGTPQGHGMEESAASRAGQSSAGSGSGSAGTPRRRQTGVFLGGSPLVQQQQGEGQRQAGGGQGRGPAPAASQLGGGAAATSPATATTALHWPEAVEPGTLSEADQMPAVHIDRAPLTVQELTPLTKLHFLFATCLFAQLFVVRGDRVLGAVLKEDMGDTKRLEQGRIRAVQGRR